MRPHVPFSYDEIARHLVPLPDGYYHPDPPPTDAELRRDKRMRAAISEALVVNMIDTLGFEVDRGRVILRGWARDQATAMLIERIIIEVAPEAEVDSRMRIGYLPR